MNSNVSWVSPAVAISLLRSSRTSSIFVPISLFVVCNHPDGLRPVNLFFCMDVPAKTSIDALNASFLSCVVTVFAVSFSVNVLSKSGWLFNFASNACKETSFTVSLKGAFRLLSDNTLTAVCRFERSTSVPSVRIAFNEKVPSVLLESLNL